MYRRSKFKNILAIDCETSGINFNGNPSQGYQAVSWGMLIIDADTYDTLDELYIEIKWNGEAEWNEKAEKIHGLSKEYLEANGMSEEDALLKIINFITPYFPPGTPVNLLGHNVHLFDKCFLEDLFHRFGMELKTRQRHIDSFSVFQAVVGAYDSDEAFGFLMGDERDEHNSLEDIRLTVNSLKIIKELWNERVGLRFSDDS
jgi:oligoribonuclease (3'-5' exoribonuclease)